MPGPRRKPIEIKKLHGTVRKDRQPQNLIPVVEGTPPAPPWLSTRAAEIFEEMWGMLVAVNVNSSVDVQMLAVCASRQEEVEICTMMIEDQGRFIAHKRITRAAGRSKGAVTTTEESFRPNPAIAQRSDAMRQLQSLLSEFGLSPAARAKVGANRKQEDANAFSDF